MAFPTTHPALSRALSERDYKDATPVQLAVVAEEAEGRDLLGQVVRPRAAARSAFRDIALIEPPQIVIQTLVRRADERLQRVPREVAILVVDRLDPRAVHGEQFAPEKIKPPAQQHELTKHRFEGVAIVAPEIHDGLEVGLQRPQ